MKKTAYTFIIFLLATALYAKPWIKFEKREHDFGTMKQDTLATATFNFKNTGDSILKIERIKSSCGCTSTLLSKDELNPGEQGTLEITFDSGDYNGEIIRTIQVFTNDPDRKVVKLKIRANVVAE